MKKGGTSRIGENPLDMLLSSNTPTPKRQRLPAKRDDADESASADRAPRRSEKKERATFHLPVALFEEIRDAVVACSGPPLRLTLAAFAESALREALERLKKEHNKGRAFPKRSSELRGGRPIGS